MTAVSDICASFSFTMLQHLRVFFGNRSMIATAMLFGLHAIIFGFWVTRLPELKEKLDLDAGELGFALFFPPIGALLFTWFGSSLISRIGEGRFALFSFVGFTLSMIPPFLAPSYWAFAGSLLIMGVVVSALDVSMNACASQLEQEAGSPVMSVFHAFFSLGGMVGAILGGYLVAAHVPAAPQVAIGGLIASGVVVLTCTRLLLPIRSPHEEAQKPRFRLPDKTVVGLAIIGLCTMVGEGAVADWSAIYLKEVTLADPVVWGWGFAGFSFTMTTGRFLGDFIIHRLGRVRTVQVSSVLAFCGALLVMTNHPVSSIAGFTLIGAGFACMIPVVFSRAGSLPNVKPAEGIAAVVGMGYVGFLVGPVLFGTIADFAGMRISWLLVVGLATLSFSLAGKTK